MTIQSNRKEIYDLAFNLNFTLVVSDNIHFFPTIFYAVFKNES